MRYGFAVVVVIFAAVGGHFFGQYLRSKPLPPAIVLETGSALGALRIEEKQTRTLVLRNRLKEEVNISRFFGDCQCVSFEPSSCTIPAGGQVEIAMEVLPSETTTRNDRLELMVGVETVEEEVRITSRSGDTLSVPRIVNAHPGVTVERLESTTGTEPRYRVRYRIEQAGYREQTLWFEVQRPGRPVQRLPLTVHTIGREMSPEQGAKP